MLCSFVLLCRSVLCMFSHMSGVFSAATRDRIGLPLVHFASRSVDHRRRRLLLLHLMRLAHFGEFLLHVIVQTLVAGLVGILVNFDAHYPFAITARVVLSIFGDGVRSRTAGAAAAAAIRRG